MPLERQASVHVTVVDHNSNRLSNAQVTLERSERADGRKHVLRFDQNLGGYTASGIHPGQYTLSAEAPGYAPDRREVQVDPAGLQTVMILGTEGMPFLYRGKVKVPFEARPDLIAVSLEPGAEGNVTTEILAIARRHNLSPVEVGEPVRRQHMRVFRFVPKTTQAEKKRIQQELLMVEGVHAVGPVVGLGEDSVWILTDELVVRFRSTVSPDEAQSIARRFHMETLRPLPQAGNAFLYRLSEPVGYALLDIAVQLVASGLVEYAEPNLISTVVDDALTPGDFLYSMQWHLPLIHCPGAWEAIRDWQHKNDPTCPDCAYGSPRITIAVVDHNGVDLANDDFSGPLSDGNPKVYQVFDFENMAANNAERPNGHGTCCAGVATALPNNAVSGAPLTFEGVVGVAGNCRLMAIRCPESYSDVAFSDMYVWVGGFDPKSTDPRFPKSISPGADVITSSYGWPQSTLALTSSRLLLDTFDFLTTYGRNGRGTLLFFSAGNWNIDVATARPWAAYPRTFGVAASTLSTDGVTEIRAPYSNYDGGTGGKIDFCAPSSSDLGVLYDPPRSRAILTTGDPTPPTPAQDCTPDAPSYVTAETTTSADATPGATSLVVTDTGGFAAKDYLIVGAPGSDEAEFSQVDSVTDGTHLALVTNKIDRTKDKSLKNEHLMYTAVYTGPAHSHSAFGGTSAATPVACGVAALLLTMRPDLTWVQVRDLMRETAVKIDAANTHPIGIWQDANGILSNQPGYSGPVYSRWYGYGRIDALAAVNAALAASTASTADVVVRDNLSDDGSVPSIWWLNPSYWDSPDIWVRNLSPAITGEVAAAQQAQADYATPGPMQDMEWGHDNYIYVRVFNRGPVATSDFYIRVYLHLKAPTGMELVYPDDFMPSNYRNSTALALHGTGLVGEVHHGPLAPNACDVVPIVLPWCASVPLPAGKIFYMPGDLLVEISPQDGPLALGPHVWENNNLAQKRVQVPVLVVRRPPPVWHPVWDFAAGSRFNMSEFLQLIFDRRSVPKGVRIYMDVLDPKVKRLLSQLVREGEGRRLGEFADTVPLEETRALDEPGVKSRTDTTRAPVMHPAGSQLQVLEKQSQPRPSCNGLSLGYFQGRQVFWLPSEGTARVPLLAGKGAVVPFRIGAVSAKNVPPGVYAIEITQLNDDGRVSGASSVELHIG